MAKAKFVCLSKTGIETFTVKLEPVAEAVSPACRLCGNRTHEDHCMGPAGGTPHKPVELESGDTSFFKDLPHGDIFLSVLTPDAAKQFEVGEVTEISFELVKKASSAAPVDP
jgi:hypothetical protein